MHPIVVQVTVFGAGRAVLGETSAIETPKKLGCPLAEIPFTLFHNAPLARRFSV